MINGFRCFCIDDNTKKEPVSDNPMSAGGRGLKINRETSNVKRETVPLCIGLNFQAAAFNEKAQKMRIRFTFHV